jgi:hypothetical protein
MALLARGHIVEGVCAGRESSTKETFCCLLSSEVAAAFREPHSIRTRNDTMVFIYTFKRLLTRSKRRQSALFFVRSHHCILRFLLLLSATGAQKTLRG